MGGGGVEDECGAWMPSWRMVALVSTRRADRAHDVRVMVCAGLVCKARGPQHAQNVAGNPCPLLTVRTPDGARRNGLHVPQRGRQGEVGVLPCRAAMCGELAVLHHVPPVQMSRSLWEPTCIPFG